MNRQISAVVFDMDGLMFNTEDIYDQVGQELLQRRGLEFTLDLKLRMMGRTEPEAYQILREICGIDDSVEQLQQENNECLLRLIPSQIRMLPGLENVMAAGRKTGRQLAIATSSAMEMAEAKMQPFDLQNQFDQIITGDQVTRGKPHPEIYLTIAERLGVAPETMLVFEDSVAGSQAAAASGAYTVAVPGSHCRDLDYSHVDMVVDRLDAEPVMQLLHQAPGP